MFSKSFANVDFFKRIESFCLLMKKLQILSILLQLRCINEWNNGASDRHLDVIEFKKHVDIIMITAENQMIKPIIIIKTNYSL